MPKVRALSAADVRRSLPMPDAIAAVASAYADLSAGQVTMPVRLQVPVPEWGGRSLFMPCYAPRFGITVVKTVSVYPANRERQLPAILGAVLALDAATGAPVALLDAASLTAIRTGAATGVACRHLARPGATVACLFGAGGMAQDQAAAIAAGLPDLAELRICSRSGTSAAALAQSLDGRLTNAGGRPVRVSASADAAAAVQGADVVVACTTSGTPVFSGAHLAPGALICGVGSFTPEMQEVPADALARCQRILVDSREAAAHESGDLIQAIAAGAITWDSVSGEVGQVIRGELPGRTDPDQIIYFKSNGLAVQDLATAAMALSRAQELGLGTEISL